MKVAFVYPEVYDIARFGKNRKEFPPFGVLYLATIVSQQNGMSVQVFSVEATEESLNLTEFDVVAFSIPSSVTYELMKSVRFNSRYADKVLLVAGGVHVQIYPEQSLRNMRLHAVSVGQGDETILELLERKDTRQFSDVKGICYKDENGNALFTVPRALKKT